jgi:hypothetical protein
MIDILKLLGGWLAGLFNARGATPTMAAASPHQIPDLRHLHSALPLLRIAGR